MMQRTVTKALNREAVDVATLADFQIRTLEKLTAP
jgi:hypothetical protein